MDEWTIRTPPAHDDSAATQPLAATEDLASAHGASDQRALPLKLAASGGSLPQLTGEIRDLVQLRLREVALPVTVDALVLGLSAHF
jgi:hypothetical protein